MIDVRFETLIKVAEEKNFTKAAMALNLTQPCVSHHISSLEDELNIVIFNRQKNNLILNVLAKGVTEIAKNIKINKQVISKVRSDANKISNMSLKKKSLKIWDLIGMDNYSRNSFKTWNANDIFNLLVTEASVQTKINAIRNLMRYSVYSSIISSLASGWY